MLATIEYSLQSNLKVSYPVLILMIEECNDIRAVDVNSHLYYNMQLFVIRFTKIRDYFNKMINMPITSIPTINYFIHSNWHLVNLDDHPDYLIKVLSVLNYLAYPITLVKRSIYDLLNNHIEYKIAEIQLDQITLHCSVKNMCCFIMDQQKY